MNIRYDYENSNLFLNQNDSDIFSFDSDNDNYPNVLYSSGTEQNWNTFENNFLFNEVGWNTGKKKGITEQDSKSKVFLKFTIDR